MDIFEAILTRRSIRQYTNQPVCDKMIEEFIKAGMYAPSAGNEQPWQFIILTDREKLNEIPKFHPYSNMLKQAQGAIVVCGDLKLEKHKEMWVQDCAAATQNILLAIHAKGLGAVWLGIYPREERVEGVKKLLNLPENIIPFSIISLGYPAEKKSHEERFDSKRIHYNNW